MGSTSRGALLAAAALALAAAPAFADTRLQGQISGGNGAGQFTCFGAPTCSGTIEVFIQEDGCSNGVSFTPNMILTNVDVSHAGTFSGSVSLSKTEQGTTHNMDGSCNYSFDNGQTFTYTASWDGVHGTLDIFGTGTNNDHLTGTFSATVSGAAPLFPMAVSASVTSTNTSASAVFTPRSQDIGTTESVFVFAHAPASIVKDLIVKRDAAGGPVAVRPLDGTLVCVLAQLGPDGQFHAVSASTMQAYLTGVLSSQQQSVTLLDNVSTANVQGATVFVGYGANAADMLAKGLYQNALSVPGPVQCTASLVSAPAAQSPSALSGLWWNPNESGWGIHFTQRRNIIFAAWYTYDSSGNPKWYVASNCTMPEASSTGTCTGTLYEVSGPAFFGTAFNPSAVHVATAGSLQVSFSGVNDATMTYTAAGQTRTVTITRQVFRTGTAPAVDYTDLWYNANESGWGMAISHQSDVMFLAWYVYDSTGKPFWYVAPACAVSGSSCSGSLYRTTGPPLGPTFNPSQVQATLVGSAIVSFVDANNAVLSYTVDGVSSTKTISRQTF